MDAALAASFRAGSGEDNPESICGSPIDLVHLSRQSMGDRALETELLALFDRQAVMIMDRLRQEGGGGRDWRRDLAHTLKGSARAVGAVRVAAAAQCYEEKLLACGTGVELAAEIDALDRHVRDACAMIAELTATG